MLVTGGGRGKFQCWRTREISKKDRQRVRYGVLCVLADWNYAANFGPLKELGWNAALEDALLDEYIYPLCRCVQVFIYIYRERERILSTSSHIEITNQIFATLDRKRSDILSSLLNYNYNRFLFQRTNENRLSRNPCTTCFKFREKRKDLATTIETRLSRTL